MRSGWDFAALLVVVLAALFVGWWFRPRSRSVISSIKGHGFPSRVFAIVIVGERVAEITANLHRARARAREERARGKSVALVEYSAARLAPIDDSELAK